MRSTRRTALIAATVWTVGALAGTHAPAVRADGPAPTKAAAKYEVRFLKGMIDHHAMAVMMADLCEERAVHEELLELCDSITATQTAEIEMMQSWLEDWYGVSHEPEMSAGMMRQMENLAELTGEEFEVEFMKMMIRHHWTAVQESRHCERRAYHEELKMMCREMAAAQSAEIRQMQEWLCDWYDVCRYGPKGHRRH